MINPHSETEGSAVPEAVPESNVIELGSLQRAIRLRPNGVNVQLAIEHKPLKKGDIILPGNVKGLEFITAVVIAAGPECKMVKSGDRVVVAAKGLVNGERGIEVDGHRVFFTQEQVIVAVIDALPEQPALPPPSQ